LNHHLPGLSLPITGITGVSHCSWPFQFFNFFSFQFDSCVLFSKDHLVKVLAFVHVFIWLFILWLLLEYGYQLFYNNRSHCCKFFTASALACFDFICCGISKVVLTVPSAFY
jgi:hypothetical protein